MCTYIPRLGSPSPIPQSHPSRIPLSTKLSSHATQQLPVAIYLFHTWQCMSVLFSSFVPPTPSPLCPQVSLHLDLYSCPENMFIRTIFLDSIYIYMLIYDICFPNSDFFHSVTDSGFIHITKNGPIAFLLWIIFHCIYVPQPHYPLPCGWAFRLLPCPHYCK